VAAALWARLVRTEPDLALDMRLRLALAPVLAASGLMRESALTLRGELRGKRRDVTPGAALRIAEAARSVHPPTAVEAARRALESGELDAAKRARIEAWIEALETDPRALIALELDPKPEEAATPAPRRAAPGVARRAEPLDPDPQALALPEAATGVELDAPRAGGELEGEVEDPHALVLDPEDR
jgi:hypothetical protein